MVTKFKSHTLVHAEKAERYHASLAKHFSRKVSVVETDGKALVQFDMGNCLMNAAGTCMEFECEADSEEGLTALKSVVTSHLNKFGELKNVIVEWTDTTTGQ